jgi:hypothetical protein
MVISASRRCDIPRFAFGWFMERLDAGFVEVENPFNPRQIKQVSLLPPSAESPPAESAELFAFWTRDPFAILECAEELERRGYGFYVMTTLNSYPAVLEPNLPSAGEVIKTMRELERKISKGRLIWRYDPVFLSSITDFEYHRRNFAGLAAALNGIVSKVIVSVYDEYVKTEKRLLALERNNSLKRLPHYSQETGVEKRLHPELRGLLAEFAGIAGKEGMEIQSCAEEDLSGCGIKAGACVDGDYIEKMFALKNPGKDRGQKRSGCLCAQSVDIGSYGSCPAGCVYCYGLRS